MDLFLPREVLDFIVSLSWESRGFLSLTSVQLHDSVCQLSLSRRRPANIRCAFRSASCLDYALSSRYMQRLVLDVPARTGGKPLSAAAKLLVLECAPPDLVRSVFQGSIGLVSVVFELVKKGRMDLLSVREDNFMEQAIGSLRVGSGETEICGFELKCNLVLPACAAPSTASLELLEMWSRDVRAVQHFESTFSFSNQCSRSCISSAAASEGASAILDFVASRMARVDAVPLQVAEAQVVACICSLRRVKPSQSAWQWMRSKTSNLREYVESAMRIPSVARLPCKGWESRAKLFLCSSLGSYRAVRDGVGSWLKEAFEESRCGSDGLAGHVLYTWYQQSSLLKGYSLRKRVGAGLLAVLEEAALDLFKNFAQSKRLAPRGRFVQALRAIMHESTISAYRVCERIASLNESAEQARAVLYESGMARDVLLRLAALRNDIALARSAAYFDGLTHADKERVMGVAVFREDARCIRALTKIVAFPTLKNIALAAEYADTDTFRLVMQLYGCYRHNTDVGAIALGSGYASIVQCALDGWCFPRGSREERRALGVISAGGSILAAPKRKLPWACPESFDEGEPRP